MVNQLSTLRIQEISWEKSEDGSLDPVFYHGMGKGFSILRATVKVHNFQEKYNTPRYRTPVRQSPKPPTMKGIPCFQPVGKGCSGCVPKVCWNNLRIIKHRNVQKFPTCILCLGVGASPLVAGHVQVPLRRSNLWAISGGKHETMLYGGSWNMTNPYNMLWNICKSQLLAWMLTITII